MIRLCGVDEAGGLFTEHLLGEVAVQEGVGDVQLMHGPSSGDGQLKHGVDRARFNNRSKSVGEVHARTLPKASNHPASFVALESAIRSSLVTKDPLARDNIGMGWPRNELPGTVPLERIKLFLHRSEPMRIPKGGSS